MYSFSICPVKPVSDRCQVHDTVTAMCPPLLKVRIQNRIQGLVFACEAPTGTLKIITQLYLGLLQYAVSLPQRTQQETDH